MRNVQLDSVDAVARDVLPIGTDYPPEHLLTWHTHRRAQFLHAERGVMRVETERATWTVPTDRAVLIPPRTRHQVLMRGVSTRSLYIEPAAAPWFPPECRVVEVAPLLRELLLAAVELPADYDPRGRAGALTSLLLHEIADLAPLPVSLTLPRHPRLHAMCADFLRSPDIRSHSGQWARELGVSERTLSRLFHHETGVGLARWRQRACVLSALSDIAAGHSITSIASRLGYASPAAFTAMFTRVLGSPPSHYAPARGATRTTR